MPHRQRRGNQGGSPAVPRQPGVTATRTISSLADHYLGASGTATTRRHGHENHRAGGHDHQRSGNEPARTLRTWRQFMQKASWQLPRGSCQACHGTATNPIVPSYGTSGATTSQHEHRGRGDATCRRPRGISPWVVLGLPRHGHHTHHSSVHHQRSDNQPARTSRTWRPSMQKASWQLPLGSCRVCPGTSGYRCEAHDVSKIPLANLALLSDTTGMGSRTLAQ